MTARFRHCNCTILMLYQSLLFSHNFQYLMNVKLFRRFRFSHTRTHEAIVLLMTLLFLFWFLSIEVEVQKPICYPCLPTPLYVCRKVILLGFARMKKGLSVIWSSAIKEGTRHTRIDCPYNRRTVALELFDESQQSGVQTARIQRLPSFHHFCYLAESGWTMLEGMFGIYVGQCHLHWQPRLAYAVTHASDFAHLFQEPATYSQLSNDTVSLLVLQALLRMEDVSRLSRFGTQVIDTRDLIYSEQCLVRSSKQFLARQVQGEFGQQEWGWIRNN